MASFSAGQAVQVYSNSIGAWVDARVLDVLEDATVRVQYGMSQKVVRPEFHAALLRQRSEASSPSRPARYLLGQAVEVFSKSGNRWVPARVREVLADGALHVQYADAQHLFKVVPPHLQAGALRAAGGAPAAAPEDGWPCQLCTFQNPEREGSCQVCLAPRGLEPGGGGGGGAEAEGAPRFEPPPGPDDAWACPRCSAKNARGCPQCEICDSRAPAAGEPAALHPSERARGSGAVAAAAGEAGHRAEAGEGELDCAEEASQQLLARATTYRHEPPRTPPRGAPPARGPGAAGGSGRHAAGPRAARSRSRSPRAGAVAEGPLDLLEVPASVRSALGLVEVAASARSGARPGPAAPALWLPRSLCDRLWTYQKEGAAWMWDLYHARQGGVLADEMGLGKTVQACAFVQAARAAGARHALVLVPVTLLRQWATEIRRWCPECPVYLYHGSAAQRGRALDAVRLPRGGVLLTSYNIVKSENQHLLGVAVDPPEPGPGPGLIERRRCGQPAAAGAGAAAWRPWDIMICDEAHVMRSISTLLGKALRNVLSNCRILLTGTPVQNRLQDMWALMDFAQPGLLGNHATFTKRFSDPIEKGSVRSAGPSAVALKRHLCDQLLQLVAPHLLRRTKESTGLQASDIAVPAAFAAGDVPTGSSGAPAPKALPPKVELVVWLHPTAEQVAAYKEALATSEVIREANDKTRLGLEVFKAIGLLKRLCNHPLLGLPISEPGVWQQALSAASASLPGADGRFHAACPQRRSPRDPPRPSTATAVEEAAAASAAPALAAEDLEDDGGAMGAGGAVERLLRGLPRDLGSLVAQSAKLRCVAAMLPALIARGHRVLVFSQGVLMMDLVEVCVLRKQGIGFVRLDGHTDIKTRAQRVESFQTEPDRYQCMLLTTRVGGYGLNLTGADRVILLDPAWNPATDAQAVDRAYRIGQHKEVRTYRLVMSGLIEDKMFRLQVFKMGLTNSALEASQQHRYFTHDEIRALFKWADPAKGETMGLIAAKHGEQDREQAAEHARADGACEGWLQAGPAIGLSVFSTLFRALAPEAPREDDGPCSEEVREMKAKICVAEQEAARLAEARSAAEGQVGRAELGAKEVAEQIASAAEDRGRAGQRAKAAQSELMKARREEAASERLLEKAVQEQLASQRHMFTMDERHLAAKSADDAAAQQCETTGDALAATERALAKAFADTGCGVQRVCGTSGPGRPPGAGVSASGAAASAARKATERVQKALDGTRAAREAAQKALAALLDAEARLVDCEAEVNVLASCEGPEHAPAAKAAEAAARGAGKESARAERAFAKADAASSGAQDHAARAVQDLKEAVHVLAEALRGGEATLVRDVRAVQQELKASARGLAAAWQAARAAQLARGRAEALRRRAARAAAASRAQCREARARGLAADRAHAEAVEGAAAVQQRRRACEAEIEEARAASVEAEMRGMGQKRRREELKAELAGAKQGLRAARAAEKEATAGRDALYGHYARAGDGMRDEATAAGSAARASAEERQRALEAIEALKAEAYDANQVVEAYESRRRPRAEADAAAAGPP